MISRPTSFVLMALAAAAGGALFHVSFEVSELDNRLTTLNRDIRDDRDAIHVLRAEWSFLNQPERLEELARRHLDLVPVSGSQLAGSGALPARPNVETPENPARTVLGGLGSAISIQTGAPRTKPDTPDRPVVEVASIQDANTGNVPVVASAEPAVTDSDRSLDDVLREITGPGAQ